MAKADPARIIGLVESRFLARPQWHPGLDWAGVLARLQASPFALAVLERMEDSGGEPALIGQDAEGRLLFCDCAAESPAGRRSLCYDRAALDSRKANKPVSSVLELAGEIGIELLDEPGYRRLQQLGEFDLKTSSWVLTPPEVRRLGGALFGDRRFGRVFIYHNGAESYYGARGFRGLVRV